MGRELLIIYRQRDKALAKNQTSKHPNDWETNRQLYNVSTTKTRDAQSNYYNRSLIIIIIGPSQGLYSAKILEKNIYFIYFINYYPLLTNIIFSHQTI